MIPALPLFHRIAGQPVIVLGAGETGEAKRRLVERAGGVVIDDLRDGIDRGARLAFVAHADEAAARADALRLRCAGVLVNVVDRPELCDFTVPALVDRAPVVVAVGTAGASAGLAKALRLRLETLLLPTLGALASALAAARGALRARWPDAAARRRALDAALTDGGPLDPLGQYDPAAFERWLRGEQEAARDSHTVEIVLRGADPDALTLREARLLGMADRLAYAPGVPAAVLARARADAARVPIAPGETPPGRAGLTVIIRHGPPG